MTSHQTQMPKSGKLFLDKPSSFGGRIMTQAATRAEGIPDLSVHADDLEQC